MKSIKKILFLFTLFSFIALPLCAKETKVAKDVKKVLKSYAGLSELKKRGFNLKLLDSAEDMEAVYQIMLPYMIQDGVPLDNAIRFLDKQIYQTYDFMQHYSVHFTDDYGTKDELLKKGYKEDEIFAYFSKGQDVYRGGKFEWEKAKDFPELTRIMMPQFPPVSGEQFMYFWPVFWTEKFYPDYWEQAAKKEYIILDLRLDQSGEYQIGQFFDYLDNANYSGQVILLFDDSSATGEYLLNYRMTTWKNGQEVPRKFKYISIGQNTIGLQNFSGEWKSYETDNYAIMCVRHEKNKWKKYEEGVGVMPDIWAENTEDIFKTVEQITGIKDFFKSVEIYQAYIDKVAIIRKEELFSFSFPQAFYEIKDEKEFKEELVDFINIQNIWYDFCYENKDKTSLIRTAEIYNFQQNSKFLPLDQYFTQIKYVMEESILNHKKRFGSVNNEDFIEAISSKLTFADDVKEPNQRLEKLFLIFNKYEMLTQQGFDVHKLDYMNTPEEIINYLQPFFLSPDGYPLDLHTSLSIKTNKNKEYSVKQTTRYIVFTNEYGTKSQLEKKGYVENKTMFYYPYHDGKFWTKEKNWRVGKQIMAMPDYQNYRQSDNSQLYYTTAKSVYMKFRNFPENEGENVELDEMIKKLANETGKENAILDISCNSGGFPRPAREIGEALKKAGINNVYIIIDKWAFSQGDHFALQAKTYFIPDRNVTLVGYPTRGGTSSGDMETYLINFPDFQVTFSVATDGHDSETEHEGWGATPDVYADNFDDVLGAIRALTGDNEIKPFETEERRQFNKGKTRWLEDDIIFEIKD
ncbi:MAG: hypothetical protein K6G09_10830 [Treponema sp.]|nr:hypothetical protein [Treponema sp.]